MLLDDFLATLFPHQCLTCPQTLRKGEEMLCTSCLYELPFVTEEEKQFLFEGRLYGYPNLQHHFACFKFTKHGRAQRLLHLLKYHDKTSVAQWSGGMLGNQLIAKGYEGYYELVAPVPLHKKKLLQRGYNQSEIFAQALARTLKADCYPDLLKRDVHQASQTFRSREDRRESIQKAFSRNTHYIIDQKRVLLVDDVLTTGATLGACVNLLEAAYCKEVGVAVMAVAT